MLTAQNLESASVLLAIQPCLPGTTVTWTGNLPASVQGLTRIAVIPRTPWNSRGAISQQFINITRTFANIVYEEHNLGWTGTFSKSNTSYNQRTNDLAKVDGCLIIGSRLRASQVSGAHWRSNNPEVVFAFRKTGREASYLTRYKIVPAPAGGNYSNHVIRVYVDVFNLLMPGDRLSSGYQVDLRYKVTSSSNETPRPAITVQNDELIEFTISQVIHSYRIGLYLPSDNSKSLYVCAMQINANHSL